MYKTVFQNSKAALAFAAMTLLGAVSMVGTSEDGGLLTEAVERFGAQPGQAAAAGQGSAEGAGEGEGDTAPASVFGTYDGPPPDTAPEQPGEPGAGSTGGHSMTAPSAPNSPTAVSSPTAPNSPTAPVASGRFEDAAPDPGAE